MIDYCSLMGKRSQNQDSLTVVTVSDGIMDVRMVHHDAPDDYTDSTDLPDGMEILLVADGIGGMEMGDQASFLTLTFFLENLQSGFQERMDMSSKIYETVQTVSADLRDNCPNSGSTLVGMMTMGRVSWVFNVGDSKCVLDTRGQHIRTKDHTPSQNCDTNIITAYIGMEGTVPVNIIPVGDCGNAILFTDGLNPVFRDRGLNIADSPETAEELCGMSIEKGSTDNVTCIIRRS